MGKRYVKPGEEIETIGNWSECMMHMRLAGKPIVAILVEHHNPAGSAWYAGRVREPHRTTWHSVTTGEAGFCYDYDGFYVVTPDADATDSVQDEEMSASWNMIESGDEDRAQELASQSSEMKALLRDVEIANIEDDEDFSDPELFDADNES